ncbi:MAG: thiamine diphosphokinase [Euryarchaeota archaeon]|nr:thiamine diphosphokinase [Euryarchaeota archaeon]
MQAKNVLIAANGTWPNQAIWKPLADCSDIVIACDGAIIQLLQNDITPDFIIGDLDSIAQEMNVSQIEQLGITVIPRLDQDSNDLAKALDYCNNLGATKIDVVGIEGGRLDHQIGAYFSLCEQESNAILHLDNWTARLVPSEGLVLSSIEKGNNISLFAIGTVKGVTLSGVKWTLNKEELLPGTNGLHNESMGGEIKISHLEGHLLLLMER